MSMMDPDLQYDLIAFVMGTMAPDEAAAFSARMADDAALREQVQALQRTLAPLDRWQAPPADAGFVDAVMARVETSSPLAYVAAHTALPPETPEQQGHRRPFISLPELFALAACVALFLSVYFPMMSTSKAQRQQIACGTHLASLSQGLQTYARANDGFLPRADGAVNVNWLQTPQRQHWRPLIQGRFVAPRSLFCDTTTGERYDEATVRRNVDAFLSDQGIRFYNVQHANAGGSRLNLRFRMPLAADPNPMFADGRVDPAGQASNSPAHGGRGQNVLFNDGSVEFLKTPLVAPADNIWRAEDVDRYTGREAPQSATDSFLIP